MRVLNVCLEAAETVAVAVDLGEVAGLATLSVVVIVGSALVLYSGIEGRG